MYHRSRQHLWIRARNACLSWPLYYASTSWGRADVRARGRCSPHPSHRDRPRTPRSGPGWPCPSAGTREGPRYLGENKNIHTKQNKPFYKNKIMSKKIKNQSNSCIITSSFHFLTFIFSEGLSYEKCWYEWLIWILEKRNLRLTLLMLGLFSSKAQGCKDFWKPFKPCHIGTH